VRRGKEENELTALTILSLHPLPFIHLARRLWPDISLSMYDTGWKIRANRSTQESTEVKTPSPDPSITGHNAPKGPLHARNVHGKMWKDG
jgi:hypothetical protein